MKKFKPGDRVRCLMMPKSWTSFSIGKVYLLRRSGHTSEPVIEDDKGHGWLVNYPGLASSFELDSPINMAAMHLNDALDAAAYAFTKFPFIGIPVLQPESKPCTCDFTGPNYWLGCRCGSFQKESA